ncbi:ATP-binding protein [Peribacillus tepidiphilus]|uniref:ATP-binding protein n=1 Tax=Peribacillus tepidiphilus TaxID=2652445 RepID=UPI001291F380|nr:ATP-binding protein [Peribacillus tepidiphilus]
MKRLSFKLGIMIFLVVFLLETVLFLFLHNAIVDTRIEEELAALQARGNSHRDVLEKSYKKETLHHIALMEAQAETEVAITNQNQEVITSSQPLDNEEIKIISYSIGQIPREGKVLENRWKTEKYIATISPFYVSGEKQGYVYMFKNTEQVQSLISRLNQHFFLAGILTIACMFLTIIFLSKALTTPLLKMKEATERLSKGDFSVKLPKLKNDELGELSNSIKILADDLNHLKNERNEFLASISHELRTPLTYLKGYADVSRRKELEESDRNKYLNIIYEESVRLERMIKSLFDLARMDRNTFTIKKEKVELCLFLNSIREKVLPAFNEKEIQLDIQCEKEMEVFIDPIRMEQVFLNLLDNARKYSPPRTKTSIQVKKSKQNVIIDIKDEGFGIPREDLAYIFERFYRVDKSRARASGGTGLGLAIVKELIEAHNGTISVQSEVNKGTTFSITISEV